MSQFQDFNAENKLRIPLSAYSAQIIENDSFNFSLKKNSLINTIILNYYSHAACTISLRIKEYKEELEGYLRKMKLHKYPEVINALAEGRASDLRSQYAKRIPSDVNWQISLQKRVKSLLTEDPYTSEEKYYGSKPGRYVKALIEEYAHLPYSKREEIVFTDRIEQINDAIDCQRSLTITTSKGDHITVKPYKIVMDPLSMYHYLIGCTIGSAHINEGKGTVSLLSPHISLRISRIEALQAHTVKSGLLTAMEIQDLDNKLAEKGVQFLSSGETEIKLWLSDTGIRKYQTQLHLRPRISKIDSIDPHIYYFECTETQIVYYFFSFGKDVKILTPQTLAVKFKEGYQQAYTMY